MDNCMIEEPFPPPMQAMAPCPGCGADEVADCQCPPPMKPEAEVLYLKGEIRDFLRAVDRGYYGKSLMAGDVESAYVKALRDAIR